MSDKHTAKKEIEDTILDAFNRWSIRDDEDYLSRWERAKGEELKILGEEVRQDSLFLTKRVFAPGFARHVSKVLRNNSVINAQRRILLKACLLSIMNESGAKTEDVIKRKGSSSAAFIQDSTDEITRRHYQRYVHEEFNEIFFPLADDGLLKKRKDDERFKPVSSVFAPGNLPPDDKEQVSLKHLEEEREATAENPDLTKRITLDSFLHLVTPEYAGELYAIYLLEGYRGRGIGQKLALNLVEKLVEDGYNSMLVWVLAKNPYREFYEKLGGVYVRSQQIEIGGASFEEAAYGWKSLDGFNREKVS
jgi:GNAT superfamily N-acetyltransferase